MFSANSSQVSEDRLYVEDVFSTYLYTGNGSTQTITNGIDLAGKGGLVWVKARGDLSPLGLVGSHTLYDTNRGTSNALRTNGTFASASISGVTAFNSNGFDLGTSGVNNASGYTYASWTFREAPKFFDVVTYTGNGVNGRQIAHNLGVTPGFIIYKCTSTATSWLVLHRSLPNGFSDAINLNTTDAAFSLGASFAPTATTFTMSNGVDWNQNGQTYVAYLFAHDTTSDGIIQCGSFTTDGSGNATVNLGWEPQWILSKKSSDVGSWFIVDTMRGMPVGSNDAQLLPNTSGAEISPGDIIDPTATGFLAKNISSSTTYIYIAIRRGPMRTPTSGTSVFSVKNYLATTSSASVTHDVTFDTEISANREGSTAKFLWMDSLRGMNGRALVTADTGAERNYPTYWSRKDQRTMSAVSAYDEWWAAGSGTRNHISYGLVRAPSFFDTVCYTGTSNFRALTHNLRASPELIIIKDRNTAVVWSVLADFNNPSGSYSFLDLSSNASRITRTFSFGNELASDPQFSTDTIYLGQNGTVNNSGTTFVAHLFASCPGVSKVGRYTGNGSSQTINCGFAAGARFVMIKRTDSNGDWYVWDTVRGIVSGNDPYLLFNSLSSEVTSNDSLSSQSSGFGVIQNSTTNINVSSATYIYLAVA